MIFNLIDGKPISVNVSVNFSLNIGLGESGAAQKLPARRITSSHNLTSNTLNRQRVDEKTSKYSCYSLSILTIIFHLYSHPQTLNIQFMKTVLLVEDDPINARVFSKILVKRGGLAVTHTENVEEVMQIAQAKLADIILMDVSLSHSVYQGKAVDGIKITQMLKADPLTANLPIILVTAHAMEGDRETFLKQSGADGYISKPVVDHQLFVDQIMALLPD